MGGRGHDPDLGRAPGEAARSPPHLKPARNGARVDQAAEECGGTLAHVRGLKPTAAARELEPARKRRRAKRGAPSRARRVGRGRARGAGRPPRRGRDDRAGLRRQPPSADPADARPRRPPHRRGGVPPLLARAHGYRGRRGAAQQPVGKAAPRCSCRARGRHLHAGPDRKRGLLPDLDDLRLGADAQALAGRRGELAAEDFRARLRPPLPPGRREELGARSAWR